MISRSDSTRLPPWRHSAIPKDEKQLDESNDSGILAVLALLSESAGKGQEFRPFMKSGSGIVYDLGSGVEVAYEKLRSAERKGLLTASGTLAFACCPKCQDLSLQTQLFCPDCSSQDLFKSDLLIHYECQSTGPINEFHSKLTNGYYCQKCRKELKRVGIDYGNPGIGFKCSSCDKVFQFPLVLSRCSLGHTSKVDEINLRAFPKYMLGGNAEGLSSLLVESRALKNELGKQNIKSRVLVSLKGSSGANHLIPLLLVPPNAGDNEGIAVEFVNDNFDLGQAILQLLMKSADLEKVRMIVVHKGKDGSIDQIKSVVNKAKVRVLDAAEGPDELCKQIILEVTSW